MVKISNIRPLTDFVRNSKAHIQHLRETESPEILTVNGEAAVVVQDAASYERMATLAEQAKQDARLQSALNYFRDGGEGIKADDVFNELDKKYL
jgi:prevent-host-death family protein